MKRMKLFVKKNYIIIIAFFATLFLYFLSAVINKIYPFGEETFIYSDMSEQYVIYFDYLKTCILNGNNLFSSFSFSLGQNFYGIFTYFCASPLNLIFLFSTKATMPTFILILVLIKISLASMNMAILLKTKLKSNISILVFSILYGLMTYNLVYSTNIMWLDPVYMLPLIILGFEKMLNGKPILYILTLTYAICTNYYISFSICIFLIIYFIYYKILNKEKIQKNLFTFIKYSIVAVLLSSIILIPTIFNMFAGKLETTASDFSFSLMYNPVHIIYKFIIGDNKVLLSDLPMITSSLIVLVFVVTYLFNKNITKRDKISTIFTISLLLTITLFACFDTVMHCFKIPNQFTYRYAFIISFFLILIASKNFDNFNVNKKNLLIYLIIGIIIFAYLKLYIGFKTVISSLFLLVYFLSSLFLKNKKYLAFIIIPLVIGELFINISQTFNELPRIDYNTYSKRYRYIREINELKPKENEFYRITGTKVTLNDALTYNYYGITSFSPTISVNSNKFLKDYLGQPLNNSYAIEYVSTTDFSDSLLGIKYKYTIDETFDVEKNSNVFPVLFKMSQNDRFKEADTKIKNQNSLYQYLSDSDDILFEEFYDYEIEDCEIENNVLILHKTGYCTFYAKNKKGKNYIEIANDNFNIIPTYKNIMTNENYGRYVILDFDKGARIFNVDSNIKLEYIHAYKMNEEKLTLLSKKLNENKLNITFHNQSKITGNIYNDLENQIIFTTIPYDEGWHIKINGKETKAFKNLDSLLAFEIPKGNLEIELSFIPKGYILGLTISFITFDLLVAIYVRKNKEN